MLPQQYFFPLSILDAGPIHALGVTRTKGVIHFGITLFKQTAFFGFFSPDGSQTRKKPGKILENSPLAQNL